MASKPIRDLSDYPRPWFYRPEIYYGLIVFPPVWSILTLRSPWHKGEGFFGIFIGGVAWFFLIASVVMSVKWVQADDDGNRHVVNLFIFVPGFLLTLLTQIQWAAHRARHGPPPTQDSDAPHSPTPVHSSAQVATPGRWQRGRRIVGRRGPGHRWHRTPQAQAPQASPHQPLGGFSTALLE